MSTQWEQALRRIEAAMATVEGHDDDERRQLRLEARARELAAERAPLETPGAERELVEVRLGGEPCGLVAAKVHAILEMPPVARIPGTEPALLGLANVRGRLLAVFDAGYILYGKPVERGEDARVLALGRSEPELGIAVDQVERVRVANLEELERAATSDGASVTLGLTPGGRVILDADALLDDGRFYVDQREPK